jgi:hypothetical protein
MTACAVTVLWIKQRPRRISHDSTAGGGMDKLSVPEQQNRTRAGRSRRRMNGELQFRFRREFMSFDEIIEELPKLTRFAGQAAEGVDPTEHHCLHSASDDNSPVPGELLLTLLSQTTVLLGRQQELYNRRLVFDSSHHHPRQRNP